MKKIIIFTLSMVLAFSLSGFAQDMDKLEFINKLADKDEVSLGEAAWFFVVFISKEPKDYKTNLKILEQQGIIKHIEIKETTDKKEGAQHTSLAAIESLEMTGSDVLTRGMLAKMTAKCLFQ